MIIDNKGYIKEIIVIKIIILTVKTVIFYVLN